MQRSAPIETHGRVMALDETVNSGGHLIALPLVGLAAAAVGVQVAGVAFAAVPLAGGLVTLWARSGTDHPFTSEPPELPFEPPVQPAAA